MTILTAAEVFRDYSTDGVPSSGAHKPVKAEIREYLGDRVEGTLNFAEIVKVAAYTARRVDVGMAVILNKATPDTLSFEAAATLGPNYNLLVKNIGVGTWTLDPDGSETIDGVASVTLAGGESCVVTCNGSALRTLFRGYAPGGSDVPIADGGTGASTASGARSNLGLAIGNDVLGPADQSAMEAASSNALAVTPGRARFHPGVAKCWAYVTVSGGNPTLQASHNITSITDTNVGRLTITIATDFSSANWAAIALLGANTGAAPFVTDESTTTAKTAGTVEILSAQSSTLTDPVAYNFVGFGDH